MIIRAIYILFAAFILAAAIFLFMGVVDKSRAHDNWINHGNYKDADGTHCCGDNDCFVVEDVKQTAAGHLLSTGELVPYSQTLPSEDGQYWRCQRYDASRRCFFAPQPSS